MSARPKTADWLRQRGGRASFAEFMAAALYDPENGYYSREISGLGKRGDFSTSATLHPILGKAIASWLQKQWQELGPLPVIEVGAGDGSLAHAVISALPWWKRWNLDYHIVDVSRPLMALQKAKLGNQKVHWHARMDDALRAVEGQALIFSNELVDAFPCRLLRKSAAGWDEMYLRPGSEGGEVGEEWKALESDLWADWSACSAELDWKEGQRVEVQESHRQWLAVWLPAWKKGRMLTIDYGAEVEALYWRRPKGTLRAYFSHHRLEGPDLYARMGQQDLTLDVNFTDLRNWGKTLGIKTKEYLSQREFVEKQAGSVLKKFADDPAVAFLQSSEGAGEAFRVLVQER